MFFYKHYYVKLKILSAHPIEKAIIMGYHRQWRSVTFGGPGGILDMGALPMANNSDYSYTVLKITFTPSLITNRFVAVILK